MRCLVLVLAVIALAVGCSQQSAHQGNRLQDTTVLKKEESQRHTTESRLQSAAAKHPPTTDERTKKVKQHHRSTRRVAKNAKATNTHRKPAPKTKVAPKKAATSASADQVSAVGESVMLDAAPNLKQDIPGLTTIDAEVGLQVEPAIEILEQLHAEGRLGDIVIVHLGTNGTFTSGEFDRIMQVLSGVREVVFVNDAVPRSWEASNNAVIAAGVERYPEKAVLADWYAASAGHPEYFAGDGFHLAPQGAQAYAALIAARIGAP